MKIGEDGDSLIYNRIPDWPTLRRRYQAFWKHERPEAGFIAQIQNPNPNRPAPEPWMMEASAKKYLDPEKLFRLETWRLSAWNWHADLFPFRRPWYGPNMFSAFAGGQPSFGKETTWYEPVIQSLDEADKIHFDEGNIYWKNHLETIDFYLEACAGQCPVALTDFGGAADLICTFMNIEDFLVAALEDSDRMREFSLRIANEYNQAMELIYRRIAPKQDGVVNWMPVWHEGTLGTVADDVAINMSPNLYSDVFAPATRIMAAGAERSILHWHDGCRHHLDTVLMEEIDAIQFGHDPSSPAFPQLITPMQRIQTEGKGLFISCVEAKNVEFFARHLDPAGLLMIIDTDSDDSSRVMAEKVVRWSEERLAAMERTQ